MLGKKDNKYFEIAKSIAEQANYRRTKMGCIAVLHNRVISTGYSSEKTHPLQFNYNKYRDLDNGECIPKLHAEIDCLSRIKNYNLDWKNVKLYIYRICTSREHGMARPCSACMHLIKDLGIKHIYYTTDKGYAYELIE